MDPTVIGILGMHRSGTSALTGLLGKIGVELGDSMRVPHPGVNAKGYWEHLDVVLAHDRMLMALDTSWDDPRPLPPEWWSDPRVEPFREELARIVWRDFGGLPTWGIKDPRMCRLLPLWRGILDETGFRPLWILTARHPTEVARSLTRRDGFPVEKSGILWLVHQLEAERGTRGAPRTFTTFDRLIEEPVGVLERIAADTGLEYPRSLAEAEADIRDFITPELRHHRVADDTMNEFGLWCDLVETVLVTWRRVAETGEDDRFRAEMDAVRSEVLVRQRNMDPALLGHVEVLYARLREAREEMEAVRRAPSWWLTKPLRLVERTSARATRWMRPRRADSVVPPPHTGKRPNHSG